MCIDMIDGVDTPEGALKRGKCGHICAQCLMQRANVYGASLPFIPAPSIHPDAIGPEEERALRELSALREQIAMRERIALEEGNLWLFD